ncbi:LIM-domain binding protein-domain-containing protein [Chiua virens]|nr:LIM-domain binding protein-domain-containing protein [Chiua virens]
MNVRHPPDMLRSQQNIPQHSQVPMNQQRFIPSQQQPSQQQQNPNHIGLMPNPPNPSMAILASGVQSNNPSGLQNVAARFQMHQSAPQQGQNPQMNTSTAPPGPSHMAQLGHNPLQSMGFPAGMMQQGINGVQVRRVQSHPQGLNQAAAHVSAMHPSQPSLNGINMAINPQPNMSSHLRPPPQQPMMSRLPSASMSPDLMGRQANVTAVPQNPLRVPSAPSQIMNSLSQPPRVPPAGLQQSLSQTSFQPTVPGHPHHPPSITSSPRPGTHSQQQHGTSNMIIGQPGPSQAPGPRPMSRPENAFVGLQNNHFSASSRIPNPGATFPFAPPLKMTLSKYHNPSPKPTPAQQFEQLQQNDNFGNHFVSQSNLPPPTRPPSHPSTTHGNSVPPRQMPPHRHSPSDPMAAHVQQQPQRPQSQPQGPPGRPPSQPGPSHTPRSSQLQLPSSSTLVGSVRITPHTQSSQSSPHQRQSPSVQQPIAPRPPQGPSNSSPAANATSSEASTSQPQPSVVPRHPVMAPPVGLGQGLIRLLQFSGILSNENPLKNQLSYWSSIVREYFTPKAIMKVTLWKDNQKNEAKPFEIGVPILPRFFLVTTQSGVKSMTLSLDGARERLVAQHHAGRRMPTGIPSRYAGPLTVHVFIVPLTSPTQPQQPPYTLKFDQLQFDAHTHEKSISLDGISGQRTSEAPKTPGVRNAPTPSPNGASIGLREEDRQWDEPRVLIDHASMPGEPVNAFGIPQATMRCLELAESVSQMTDLIVFANETQLGPMDALVALAKKLREEGHNPAVNGGFMGPVPGGGGPGGFHGFGGPPTSALYPGMSSAILPIQSMTSGTSHQNIPPPSADTPQKQSKLPTSGPAPPAPNQPPAPSQAGLSSSTPTMATATLKRKPTDTNSPTIGNAEPQSKRTRKQQRRNG